MGDPDAKDSVWYSSADRDPVAAAALDYVDVTFGSAEASRACFVLT